MSMYLTRQIKKITILLCTLNDQATPSPGINDEFAEPNGADHEVSENPNEGIDVSSEVLRRITLNHNIKRRFQRMGENSNQNEVKYECVMNERIQHVSLFLLDRFQYLGKLFGFVEGLGCNFTIQ